MIPNTRAAFIIPEEACAQKYSVTHIGAINILLKFLDHMFHILPTEIVYCVIRTISHKSIPINKYCAITDFCVPVKYRERNPKRSKLMKEKTNMSKITSYERNVIKYS